MDIHNPYFKAVVQAVRQHVDKWTNETAPPFTLPQLKEASRVSADKIWDNENCRDFLEGAGIEKNALQEIIFSNAVVMDKQIIDIGRASVFSNYAQDLGLVISSNEASFKVIANKSGGVLVADQNTYSAPFKKIYQDENIWCLPYVDGDTLSRVNEVRQVILRHVYLAETQRRMGPFFNEFADAPTKLCEVDANTIPLDDGLILKSADYIKSIWPVSPRESAIADRFAHAPDTTKLSNEYAFAYNAEGFQKRKGNDAPRVRVCVSDKPFKIIQAPTDLAFGCDSTAKKGDWLFLDVDNQKVTPVPETAKIIEPSAYRPLQMVSQKFDPWIVPK